MSTTMWNTGKTKCTKNKNGTRSYFNKTSSGGWKKSGGTGSSRKKKR